MCGIVAIFSRRGPVSRDALERATRSLHHRGPDGQRTWISPDGRVGLGHARLSIIDLAGGQQPIASEDDRTHLVANGEFYDYESLQRGLESRGHHLRTRSDSEVALHLYEELGAHALHDLRGEFAFALWDGAHQTLFAARDRFGIKPLFYAEHDGIVYLASEVKALFAAGVPARWDGEMVIRGVDVSGSPHRSLYHGVQQVPPGHYLLVTERHLQLACYWDFHYPPAGSQPRRSDGEYAEEFRAALDEAVRLRLRADVPVGCYLSGGLDSCAVLGLASRHHPEPIHAFTLTFDRAEYDEGAIATEMAAHCGARFYPIPIRQDDLADHFADATAQTETFCLNAHGVAKYLLSRAVREAGYKVVLTGEGSDEILGGYAHFRRDMLLYNTEGQDAAEVPKLLAQLEAANPVSRGLLLADGDSAPMDSVRRILGHVPSWFEVFSARALKMQEFLAPEWRQRFAAQEPYRHLLNSVDVRGQLAGRDAVNQALYLWSKTALPGYILCVLGDRMEMAHSIEGRVPFLDHHLVEVIRSQPVAQKIRGMTEKYVLREATRHVITDTVYRRQKHPFLSPPATLHPGERLYTLLQDTLRGPALGAMPFFDRGAVVGLLDRLPSLDTGTRVAYDQLLMLLLSACVLQERYRLAA
ncbi:MAG TPA: asparagine synthase (glutamine-hydrolyzing) [Gemmatimonadales bacterium]|nr:asparagine synthase (glutamine-hydrolyzing) [Gemmatimonadales bacterium]